MYEQTYKCSYLINYDYQSGKDYYGNNTVLVLGSSAAIATVGGTIGALFGGGLLKYGKKFCIHIANLVTIIGCAIIAASPPYFKDGTNFQ